MRRLVWIAFALAFGATTATAFLISNSPSGGGFAFESIPANRRPANLLVDTDSVPGVADPIAVVRDLAGQWNAIPEAEDVFGTVTAGGSYNGDTVGETFGTFSNTQYEVAFDPNGEILAFFGISPGVLGITLKSVIASSGTLLDFLVVINTSTVALSAPGSGATREELFRSTLLHELGHGTGLSHTAAGIANSANGFGLIPATVQQIPTMYAFRLPQQPQFGGSLNGDDRIGLIENYPDDTSGLGSISGTVRGLGGAPVNEIAVRAVGPSGFGEEHYGVLTNVDGSDAGTFTIPHLPPGAYRVVVETVNGRASVGEQALVGNGDGLGSNLFVRAMDELWQLGDTYDPATDDPGTATFVQVRAGRDSGSIDFVLDAVPFVGGISGSLANGDSVLPTNSGGFRFADYLTFAGTAGNVVTINVAANLFVPQVELLSPSTLELVASDFPAGGGSAVINVTLPETGAYTLIVLARAPTGNIGGSGNYSVTVTGAAGALPQPPVVTPAAGARGPGDPGAQEFGSPVANIGLLQVRVNAPSNQELWIDQVTVRASGTAGDRVDIDEVRLIDDRNGNGRADGGEPTLGTGAFASDNGTLVFNDVGAEVDAGDAMDLLVVYDATVESVSSTTAAGLPPLWLLLIALVPLLWKKRVHAVLLLCVLVPVACGGGGGGGPPAFDPNGAIVTFQATVGAGDIVAFTPATDPGSPLALPAAGVTSGTLSLSN